jgi:hypothetical protein
MTRVLLCTLFLLILNTHANAQYFRDEETLAERKAFGKTTESWQRVGMSNQVRARKVFCQHEKSNEKYLCGVTVYDIRGNQTRYTGFDMDGDTIYYSLQRYNDSDQVVYSESKMQKKPVEKVLYVYDSSNKLTERTFYRNGKILWRETLSYNEQGNKSTVAWYRTDELKLLNRYEYDYYADGKRKETRLYGRKNKLIGVYTYECGEIGKTAAELARDTAKICVKQEQDSLGNRIRVVEETNDRGGRISRVDKYDPEGKMLGSISRYRDGTVFQLTEYKYQAETGLISGFRHYYLRGRKKLDKTYLYSYDNAQNLEKVIVSEPKKKPVVRTYSYEF